MIATSAELVTVIGGGADLAKAKRRNREKSRPDTSAAAKQQRVRDPVHDLIEFGASQLDQLAWKALDTREFQRLRRIKQLGFSEFVFPGATHSRFAHSIGVFHTARWLAQIINTQIGNEFDEERALVAQVAALVHDLGHGPFSHAFEEALQHLGIKKRHEEWTSEILVGDTEVSKVLRANGAIQDDVADLLASDTPVDIYSAIVSSQFDADRLDYIRRDRLMTGAQHGGFDFPWLMANLEVDRVPFSLDGETYAQVQGLVLGNKAFQAAEAYVLGLFHMYFTVYFHKTTRSAERMVAAVLERVGHLVQRRRVPSTGLDKLNPIVQFLGTQTLGNYLSLDDTVVWASLHQMAKAKDADLAELSSRLLNRKLYKAIDVTARLKDHGGDASVALFRARLSELNESLSDFDVLEDHASRSPYKRRGFDSAEAFSKVLIRRDDGTKYVDLASRSDVVRALQPQSTYRVYVKDDGIRKKVEALFKGLVT